ncbi:MAG: CinA family protein [Rhodobacterales bacterium]
MKSIKILQTICINKKILISTAESCTGGALAEAITSEPGASKIFNEGFIVYSNNAKIKNLSVSPKTLQIYGAVSEEVAIEMAINCRNITNSTVSVSITGIAGPGGSGNKPEGRVCFGVTFNKKIISKTIEFGAIGRENVRIQSVKYALKLLINTLTE